MAPSIPTDVLLDHSSHRSPAQVEVLAAQQVPISRRESLPPQSLADPAAFGEEVGVVAPFQVRMGTSSTACRFPRMMASMWSSHARRYTCCLSVNWFTVAASLACFSYRTSDRCARHRPLFCT
eukprot:1627433-Heterocapsa_arctica.AAC.1